MVIKKRICAVKFSFSLLFSVSRQPMLFSCRPLYCTAMLNLSLCLTGFRNKEEMVGSFSILIFIQIFRFRCNISHTSIIWIQTKNVEVINLRHGRWCWVWCWVFAVYSGCRRTWWIWSITWVEQSGKTSAPRLLILLHTPPMERSTGFVHHNSFLSLLRTCNVNSGEGPVAIT